MNAIRLALVTALASIAAAAQAQSALPQANDQAAIEQVLQTSAKDWSQGNLAAFMQCYENTPQTAFVAGQGLIKGYDTLKSHYAATYASGTHKMGQLALTIIDDRPLPPDYALITGHFALTRPAADGGNAGGIFTLLMHRTAQGWRIVYDHTS